MALQGAASRFWPNEYALLGLQAGLAEGFKGQIAFDPAVALLVRHARHICRMRVRSMKTRLPAVVLPVQVLH
ncbi:hypothetical protein D3C80_1912810 [compost metagenome]